MKIIKVSKTEPYKDSNGEHLVCRGKLVLIKDFSNSKVEKIEDGFGYKHIERPIIISEVEPIEIGDKVAHNEYGFGTVISPKATGKFWIVKFDNIGYNLTVIGIFKILALPENFSSEHLQDIADGKLKDGDQVFVECGYYQDNSTGWEYSVSIPSHYFIKSNNNYVQLFSPKKEGGWEEFFLLMPVLHDREITRIEMIDWANKHFNPPIKKVI